MKLYLVIDDNISKMKGIVQHISNNANIQLLQSFYKSSNWCCCSITKDYILDSGCYSFIMDKTKLKGINLRKYVDCYCRFIKRYNVDKYMEMDLDAYLAYKDVCAIRKYIESQCNTKSIPVWHKSRGRKEFTNLIKQYDYIAIGGLAISKPKPEELYIYKDMVREAHQNNCKVHMLGVSNVKILKSVLPDSSDASSWIFSRKINKEHKFINNRIVYLDNVENKSGIELLCDSFGEWIKYQNYLKGIK